MYIESLGSRLRNARNSTGLSQAEVEKETGILRTKIAKIELGKQNPDCETLGTLADFYEVSVDWLLGTKGIHNINKNKKIEIEYYKNNK